MTPTYDKGTSSVIMYHPVTDDAYEIDCNWEYSHEPATYWEPSSTEFKTFNHKLVSINGVKTNEPIPEWINWEDYEYHIYEQEF